MGAAIEPPRRTLLAMAASSLAVFATVWLVSLRSPEEPGPPPPAPVPDAPANQAATWTCGSFPNGGVRPAWIYDCRPHG